MSATAATPAMLPVVEVLRWSPPRLPSADDAEDADARGDHGGGADGGEDLGADPAVTPPGAPAVAGWVDGDGRGHGVRSSGEPPDGGSDLGADGVRP